MSNETVTCVDLRPDASTGREIELFLSLLESEEMQSMDLGRWRTNQGELITLWAFMVKDAKSNETSRAKNSVLMKLFGFAKSEETSRAVNVLFMNLLSNAGISRLAWPRNLRTSTYIVRVIIRINQLKQFVPLTLKEFNQLQPRFD
jgi:hypothetical protein